ncbi:phosphohydrolase [Microbacterium sp. PRF11]|uniref:phosphohydrolase n=1 Tax=Microbacterium sp. PRF11 TaxID=2962593 RepID=UPI0028817DB0|nr:phosphohydrolase [Microbacterium sp. PRF11]MDT0117316.1 phosphohydrolase [Microbacterium sp. PRF11]
MAEADELLKIWSTLVPTEGETWALARPGPPLEAVAARLSSVPRSFLDDEVSITALSGDVAGVACAAAAHAADPRVRRGAAIGLWLLASEQLVEPFRPALAGPWAVRAVDALALRVAPVVDPLDWLADDERREEAARTFVLWAGFLPAGEDRATAQALWQARDSLRRSSALAEAYAAYEHREEIARRLAEARAREAAARYSSE